MKNTNTIGKQDLKRLHCKALSTVHKATITSDPKADKAQRDKLATEVRKADKAAKVKAARPSVEAQSTLLKPYAIKVSKDYKTFRKAAQDTYVEAFNTWLNMMNITRHSVDYTNVNAFNKVFTPCLIQATDWSKGTCRARLSEWRKGADLPQNTGKTKHNGGGRKARGPQAVLSFSLNSKDAERITFTPSGKNATDSTVVLTSLVHFLTSLVNNKSHGFLVREAMQKVLEATVKVSKVV